MRELGVEPEGADPRNDNIVSKVEASHMTSFSDLYSVKDLLGVGAYGVVLKVKNKVS